MMNTSLIEQQANLVYDMWMYCVIRWYFTPFYMMGSADKYEDFYKSICGQHVTNKAKFTGGDDHNLT